MKNQNQGELLTSIILKVFHLNGTLNVVGDKLTSEFGMTSARWKVMGAISGLSRKMSVPDIADKMGLSRQAVQRLVNEMKQSKLVAYSDNPNHRRSKHVVLTKQGKKIYQQIEKKQLPWVKGLAENLSDQVLTTTLTTLDHISKLLKS